jgi:hypothetical protein
VRWAEQIGGPDNEWVAGVGADASGRTYVLVQRTDGGGFTGGTLQLHRVDASGAATHVKTWSFRGFPAFWLAVTPAGNFYVAAAVWCPPCGNDGFDLGAGDTSTSVLARFRADGTLEWQNALALAPRSVVADEGGNAIVQLEFTLLDKYGRDGALLWSVASNAERCAGADDVVCAVAENSGVTRVEKRRGSDGSLVWERRLQGLVPSYALDAHANGAAIVGVRAGELVAGDVTVREGPTALVMLDAGGVPRWGRGFEWLSPPFVSISPAGAVAIAGAQPGCGAVTIHSLRAGGDTAWTSLVPTDGQCTFSLVLGGLLHGARDAVTAAGWFHGTMLVGDERWRPQGSDVYVIQLAP